MADFTPRDNRHHEPEPPGFFRYIPWLGRQFAHEWPVIRGAPYTVIFVATVAAVLSIIGTFFFVEYHYSERVETLEARDKYISGQLDDYHRAFPGKSPDEIIKEVASMRSDLTATQSRLDTLTRPYAPRHLRDDEKDRLRKSLVSFADSKPLLYIFFVSETRGETIRYTKEFRTFFQEIGINAINPTAASPTSDDDLGIMVGFVDPEHRSELGNTFVKGLEDAGFQVRVVKWQSDFGTPGVDFDLFVGLPKS